MNANVFDYSSLKQGLESNYQVSACAKRYGNTGDPTSMKMCYLLRRCPNLSVSQLAELVGVSISAASRCLKKLSHSEVVVARKSGQSVLYVLHDNDFTQLLIKQLEGVSK